MDILNFYFYFLFFYFDTFLLSSFLFFYEGEDGIFCFHQFHSCTFTPTDWNCRDTRMQPPRNTALTVICFTSINNPQLKFYLEINSLFSPHLTKQKLFSNTDKFKHHCSNKVNFRRDTILFWRKTNNSTGVVNLSTYVFFCPVLDCFVPLSVLHNCKSCD